MPKIVRRSRKLKVIDKFEHFFSIMHSSLMLNKEIGAEFWEYLQSWTLKRCRLRLSNGIAFISK
jgi:hypothetical protein